jgi:hypothetical protein
MLASLHNRPAIQPGGIMQARKPRDWEAAHSQRWSRSNHLHLGQTPRVSRESLRDLGGHRSKWTHEEVADAIIMVMCVGALVVLGVLAIIDRLAKVAT